MNKNLNKRINRTVISVWKTYLYMKIKTYSMQWEVELCSFIYTCKKHLKIVFFPTKEDSGFSYLFWKIVPVLLRWADKILCTAWFWRCSKCWEFLWPQSPQIILLHPQSNIGSFVYNSCLGMQTTLKRIIFLKCFEGKIQHLHSRSLKWYYLLFVSSKEPVVQTRPSTKQETRTPPLWPSIAVFRHWIMRWESPWDIALTVKFLKQSH